MQPKTIIIDGEPIEISRQPSIHDCQPMYQIRLLNYLDYHGTYSAAVGCNLRAAITEGLELRRAVMKSTRLAKEFGNHESDRRGDIDV
ncbi:hypothetical protein [Microbulbifer spongiae]|uniref:Uncharacterized protein n=1 Tax=Microbulbifer spongiae TaxID=2944933 RepID=A0ABY9EAC7_9GAMM|nr:hypothetical protein [Microbulbifer sp. MI-G]WKD48320.1 hypothetical protein M8T91_10275 [Microbulbifer sp. MI-G]